MNSLFRNHAGYATALTIAAAVSLTLAGCATAPTSPDGASEVRAKLTRLQADPDLANRAPVALQEADHRSSRRRSAGNQGCGPWCPSCLHRRSQGRDRNGPGCNQSGRRTAREAR